jgi:hypothetical protein
MKDGTRTPDESEPASGLLKTVLVGLFLVDEALLALEKYATGFGLSPELVGALLAPVIFAILIIGIARLFKLAKSPRSAATVAVVVFAMFAVGTCGGLLRATTAKTVEAKAAPARLASLAAASANAGKRFPVKVDSLTTLRGVSARGDTLVYWYQVNMEKSDLDPAGAETLRAQLTESACGNAEFRSQFLSPGVIIRYHYADLADRPMTSVDVTEAVCKTLH